MASAFILFSFFYSKKINASFCNRKENKSCNLCLNVFMSQHICSIIGIPLVIYWYVSRRQQELCSFLFSDTDKQQPINYNLIGNNSLHFYHVSCG